MAQIHSERVGDAPWLLVLLPSSHLALQPRPARPERNSSTFLKIIMADEMIVVDDFDDNASVLGAHHHASPDSYAAASTSTLPPVISGPATRRRVASVATTANLSSERTTRSAAAKGAKPAPKLKLKLNEKGSHVSGMSFLGTYDRELDSEDEDLTFEEQFILRMPAGEDCERLRRAVAAREVNSDVWFKFKGAYVHMYVF